MASEKKTGGEGGKVVEPKKPDAGQSTDTKDSNTDQQTQGGLPGGSGDQAPTDSAAATPPPPPPPANAGNKQKALQIRAKGERFRRAGLTFGREPTVLKLADLSKEQVAALKAEPQLAVEEIEI